MKNVMKTVRWLIIILLVAFAQAPNKFAAAQILNKDAKLKTDYRRPEIALEEALDVAKKYVQDHQIDVSEKYIDSVQLNSTAPGGKGKYWKVTWEIEKFVKGGQIFILIYMDKSVEVRYGE